MIHAPISVFYRFMYSKNSKANQPIAFEIGKFLSHLLIHINKYLFPSSVLRIGLHSKSSFDYTY